MIPNLKLPCLALVALVAAGCANSKPAAPAPMTEEAKQAERDRNESIATIREKSAEFTDLMETAGNQKADASKLRAESAMATRKAVALRARASVLDGEAAYNEAAFACLDDAYAVSFASEVDEQGKAKRQAAVDARAQADRLDAAVAIMLDERSDLLDAAAENEAKAAGVADEVRAERAKLSELMPEDE
ncbi:MAG: hypothetical protein AAF561_14020 [Planctomycetota bacterium]